MAPRKTQDSGVGKAGTVLSRRERDKGTTGGRALWGIALFLLVVEGIVMVSVYEDPEGWDFSGRQTAEIIGAVLTPSVLTCLWMLTPWLRSFTGARKTLKDTVALMWPVTLVMTLLPKGTGNLPAFESQTMNELMLGIIVVTPWLGFIGAIIEVVTRAWQESPLGTVPIPED